MDFEELLEELKANDVDLNSQAEIRHFLTSKKVAKNDQIEFVRELGFTPFEEEKWN